MEERQLADGELYESRFKFKESKSNFRFMVIVIAFVFAVLCLRLWWVDTFGGVVVDGSSMRRTLKDGDKLLMRYAHGQGAERGDVIVVYVGDYPECESVTNGYLIKRLIAIEGDRLYCENGQIYICYAGSENFVALSEPYAYYGDSVNNNKQNYDFSEYQVGENEIFFLGDNRSYAGSSIDSRYNQTSGSHLADRLYKKQDIYGVVPNWAIEHRESIEKILF